VEKSVSRNSDFCHFEMGLNFSFFVAFQVHAVTFGGKEQNEKARQSIAFFLHPDDQYMVQCLDGSNKYPPISGKDYLREKMFKSFTKYFGENE
jgi:isopenicillin N synthase-like dioxygenase